MKKEKEKKVKEKPTQSAEMIATLKRNEKEANKKMGMASIFFAVLLFALWILYLTKVFPLRSYFLVNIFFPTNAALLTGIFIASKTKIIGYKGFKIVILLGFTSVFFVLNVIVPKHGILTWALPIVLANHFYNPKMGRLAFFLCIGGLFVALYAGMFVGEYDPNLLTEGIIRYNAETDKWSIYQPDTVEERYQMLYDLLQRGENRYLKVFVFYYLPRALALTAIFFVSDTLNTRTNKMMQAEIAAMTTQNQMETELAIAQNIQHGVLPPAVNAIHGTSLLAELVPTKEVGGDLYFYFPLDDDHLALGIGDVSGKGIPAAMFMMKAITCVKAYASLSKKPSETLSDVNKALLEGNDEMQMFVTCFFGILNTKTGAFEYTNAGHNKPIIGHNGSYRYLDCSAGFILGAMDYLFLKDETTTLQKGDVLFLYTDGITEAKNPSGELYGDLRLLRFCNSKHFTSLLEMHYELKDDIGAFVKGADQADDMTYLFVNFQGDEIVTKELEVPAVQENLSEVLDFVSKSLKETGNGKLLSQIYVVVDEIASNIVKYAYPDEPLEIYIRFSYNKTKKEITLTFVDRGSEFDPLTTDKGKTAVDINGNEGGLGIHIVKTTMDSVTYNRINNRNILVLKKRC